MRTSATNFFTSNRREQDYPRPEFCQDCKEVHMGPNRCRILCQYCHDFHLKKNFIGNICPLMYPFAKKIQQKNSYECRNCLGEGAFYEEVEIVKYQCTKKYQERLKQWAEMLKKDSKSNHPKPKRRVLKKQVQDKEINCQECKGSGRIMRMIYCCSNGCATCRGDKHIINPIWKLYRKEPIINDELFQCSICLADVQVSSKKFVLHCRHEFHPQCIFRWMKQSKKCPVCRQKDIYLQGQHFGHEEPPPRVNFHPVQPPMSPVNSELDSIILGEDSWND